MSESTPPSAGTPDAGFGADTGAAGEPGPTTSDGSQPSPGEVRDTGVEDADALRVLVTCVLAWALPGLGHLSMGRVLRGLVFGLVIMSLFIGGIVLDGQVYRPQSGMPLTYLAAFGAAGVGLPYVVAHAAGHGGGDLASPTFDYGNTFTLVAGLLNLLVVLDAYDVAAGRR